MKQGPVAQVIGRQLLASRTSVGAHYREGTRARSNAEFISKLEGALQEMEETAYWFELLAESGRMKADRPSSLQEAVRQLIAIFTT
jgi:four helix bundle protein